ncbi:uncharacterized protein LOC132545502 [Ylistrum balloti]|uniref:uncharacterized protein LOC132545502 n=1 Tax=Ylistrum balloti TaxID=509963 RepID=UPI0029059B46|nr:uncharacterized protein LOC132545502 [Ylistrum balloti]
MAGDLKRFVLEERENIRRYNANIDAIIEKYGKPSKYVDIVDLENLEITKNKGMLHRQSPRYFGHTKLCHTKRQEESMLIQEDNSLLSYSMSTAGSESTDYGSKQLNSSGGSFVPRIGVKTTGDDWLDKSRRSHRSLNTFSLTESKHPNQGLDTFSLAEQVDDAEDAVELLSLQETMMTFIENDKGEPSDAETLSSSSSDSNNEWQDDLDVNSDNNDVNHIESEKSEIDSDKSDVGDITISHQRQDKNMWSPQNHRGDDWLDRQEDQFTLISSSQDSGISNLHDGIRSSDGVEWSVNLSPSSKVTGRWRESKKYINAVVLDREKPISIVDLKTSSGRQCIHSSTLPRDKHDNHRKSPETVVKRLTSPITYSKVNQLSDQKMHAEDKVDEDITGMKVSRDADYENQPQSFDLHGPNKKYISWRTEKLSQDVKSDNLNKNYHKNHVKFRGRNESELEADGKRKFVDIGRQSRAQGRERKIQGSRTPLPNTTEKHTFNKLVSKSVPSKLMVQNLKDLPQGKLTASTIAMDPLTSMEKVYRWLSPTTNNLCDHGDKRYKVNARRRLQLATSSTDKVFCKDSKNTFDNNLGVNVILERQKCNADSVEQMDIINTETEMDFLHKQVTMIHQDKQHSGTPQRLITEFNSVQNLNSPEKQTRTSFTKEDQYVSQEQPVTPKTNTRTWKSPFSTPQGSLKSPHGTQESFQNKSSWESPNMTRKQNRASLFSSDDSSSPHKIMSPNGNSPWRSRSCDQRFHPYFRKNPDSPSAIFARLKLSISSPSSSRDSTLQQNRGEVEMPTSSTVRKLAKTSSPHKQPTRNYNLESKIMSPLKSRQQLNQIEKSSTSERPKEAVLTNVDNMYHRHTTRNSQQKNLSPDQVRSKELSVSSNRSQYLKKSTSNKGNARAFDVFDTFGVESSSQMTAVSKGQHFPKPNNRPLQKYSQKHLSTCPNKSYLNPSYSTCEGQKVQLENKLYNKREQNYRSQRFSQDHLESISPLRNQKHSGGQDFNRKENYQSTTSVPKGETEGAGKSHFPSPIPWKAGKQENNGYSLVSSLQDSGVECTYKGYSDDWESKHVLIPDKIRTTLQDKPLQSTCESPLVKISSKPKALTPSTSTCLKTVSETLESSPRSYMNGTNNVERTKSFKRPNGAFVSLRDKLLTNNQRHSSTPMKHTPQFLPDNTLSTIHATNSDIDSDSSDEMVLTISPSY